MKWIKFSDEFPLYGENVQFLVSDGKEVWICYEEHEKLYFTSETNENEFEIERRLTHWCLLENVSLPNQPERSKREDIEITDCKTCKCVCHNGCKWCKHDCGGQ